MFSLIGHFSLPIATICQQWQQYVNNGNNGNNMSTMATICLIVDFLSQYQHNIICYLSNKLFAMFFNHLQRAHEYFFCLC